jgi:hypothetical protein
MIRKIGSLWPVRRIAALAVGFWDAFLRDNKVIPPVLAVAALFVFAWIVVGSFIGSPDDEPVSSQNEVAQSDGGAAQPPAPEIENPNADSYAAYQSKDPFRQLFQTAESTTQEDTTLEDTVPTDDTDGAGDATDDTISDDTGDTGGTGGTDGTTSEDLEDPGDGTSTGAPGGAADGQYSDDAQSPREDPTDTQTPDTPAPGTGTPAPQAPAPQAPAPQTPPDGLFDSGGDLEDPYAP